MSATNIELRSFGVTSSYSNRILVGNELDDAEEEVLGQSPRATVHELLPTTRRRQFLVLVSGFFAVFLTIGVNQAYGVFQSYYVSSSSESNAILSPSEAANTALVAFIGTLAAGLTWAGSIFVNPLMARCSDPRYLTTAGAACMCAGYALAGFSSSIWHLLLTQGLLSGIGSSLLYFPILSTAPEYFDTHRGAAMGIILSGAGIGGLALSPLTNALLSSVGPRWTLRAIGLVNLVIGMPIALTAAPSRSSTRRPTLVNVKLAMKPAFILQATAALLQASGNFVPLTFLPEFSIALGYTAAFGALLLSLNNGVNSVSRILMGAVADKMGRQNTLVLSVLASALSVGVLWLGSAMAGEGAKGLWISFVVLYGLTAGGYNALFPTTITEVFGIQAYASVNGFIYFVRGLGAFFGSPVGGVILGEGRGKEMSGQFKGVIWYDTALLLGSSLCVIGVRGFDAWDKKCWKWKA
ncbi:major facilitator superfamily protein [Rhizodiscina lignyota]|uniref:Major facilitator superfamily protein n=1 Tax=Rhizodiscina lignyota TaxID=1504668 RepID=A0A9P4IBL0_9PEZI|nr:major facilitator superfamily protein [Rhizodiscina lignyota]